MKKISIVILTVVFLTGCTHHAKLYKKNSTKILNVKYWSSGLSSKQGTFMVVLPNGNKLKGQWNSVDENKATWGSIFGSQYSSVEIGGKAKGLAIATGHGRKITCEYVADGGSAYGTCKDLNGNIYKLMTQ